MLVWGWLNFLSRKVKLPLLHAKNRVKRYRQSMTPAASRKTSLLKGR